MPDPRIIAHRGASHAFAENTHAAFDAALAEGADGIELDLQLSADGVVMVFHDDKLGKLGEPQARIRDFNCVQLQAMDAGGWFGGAAARMPTLDEVLENYAHRTRLYLEIKFTENNRKRHSLLASLVAAQILNYPQAMAIHVLSFHPRAISTVLAVSSGVACVRNLHSRWALPVLRLQLPRLAGVCINIDRFGGRHRRMLARLGKPLYSYTCDSPRQLSRARMLGVGHVISSYPERSRALLAEHAPHEC